jgi:hypothetical protein
MTRKYLNTGVAQPDCVHHNGNLFCNDTQVCHQLHVNADGLIQTDTPSLAMELIGSGIRYCDITCVHCLSEAMGRKPS